MAFYQELRGVIRGIHKADKILLLGDFNARVGKDHNTWNAIGRHGLCVVQNAVQITNLYVES